MTYSAGPALFVKTKSSSGNKIQYSLEILTCDPQYIANGNQTLIHANGVFMFIIYVCHVCIDNVSLHDYVMYFRVLKFRKS